MFHQPFEGRHVTVSDGPAEVMVAQAINLQHDQAAPLRVEVRADLLPGQPFDQALVEGAFVIDFQDAGQEDIDGREEKSAHDRAEQARHLKHGQEPGGEEQRQPIDQEADDEDGDETQRPCHQQDNRSDHQVDNAQQKRSRKGIPEDQQQG
jgi:hypothetical protein